MGSAQLKLEQRKQKLPFRDVE